MTGNIPIDKGKLGRTKRHILTDKIGIPLSVVKSSANTHNIKRVADVVDNTVIKRSSTHKLKKQKEEEIFNIYVLIKHTIPRRRTRTNQTRICNAYSE